MKKLLLSGIFALLSFCLFAQKQVYIPIAFSTDPALKEWSWDRSYQSANFVLFWGPTLGTDPASYANPDLRFVPQAVCDTLEKSYHKYVTELGFCSDAPSKNLGKYKIIIVMNDTWAAGGPAGWAFGGSYEGVIGAMWVHPNSTRDGGVLSHELTHSLQGMISIQENTTGGGFTNPTSGFFWEGHANFMRNQVYPNFAGGDMPRRTATSSFHWSSTRHHYGNFNLLFRMQDIDGISMINRLWKESLANEHPLTTYRRLKGYNQSQLNDFIYDYAKREVTFDYTTNQYGAIMRAERNRLKAYEPHYQWRLYTMLNQVNDSLGRYVVPDEFAPQDYGYNMIPLYPTGADKSVRVKFKGHTEVNATAGWRYGFVAVKADGVSVRYSPVYGENESIINFQLQADETAMYLVVVGAPTTQTDYEWEPGWPKIKRYPYELRIEKALPEGYQANFRAEYKTNGHVHPNGGGWVANSATVAPSVYVGPKALVLGTSNLSGNVKIDGTTWVENTNVSDKVVIDGNSHVWNSTLSGEAKMTENAILNFSTISGNALVKGNTMSWGVTYGGTVVMGGDGENGNCNAGVYLQVADCDGRTADNPKNADVNAPYALFTDAQMLNGDLVGPTVPAKLKAKRVTTCLVDLTWEASSDEGSGVKAYLVYMNNTLLDTTSSTQYTIIDLNPGSPYSFSVQAIDQVDNASATSNSISVMTKGAACTSTFPYKESFENGLGSFLQSKYDGTNWKPRNGGAADGNRYLYLESSLDTYPKVADLSSYCFDLTNTYLPVFELSYLMTGLTKGTLAVEITTTNGRDNLWTTLWSKKGDQGSGWKTARISLAAYVDQPNVNIRIKGIAAKQGEIGIDAVQVNTSIPNIAPLALASTSHVSPWENLAAVNDTFVPTTSYDRTHAVYGNWDGEANYNTWNWVQYDWTKPYRISQTDLYWFTDDGGILKPDSAYVEYWKDSTWAYAGSIGTALNQWNTLFPEVITKKLRVNFIGQRATGILEWQVWGLAEKPSISGARIAEGAETTLAKPYHLYPNPVEETLHIQLTEKADIVITDALGKSVYRAVGEGSVEIKKAAIGANGLYFVRILSGGRQYTEKLIIQ